MDSTGVRRTSSPKAADFVASVLRLHPHIAAFDCDGTLWAGDAGEGFFDWELKQGLLSDEIVVWARARYADYQSGKVDEETMCGEMVTLHRGLNEDVVQRAAGQYFDSQIAGQIFPEMSDLVHRLRESGCDIWAVSSTNEWAIRAAMTHFGISENRILAAKAQVEQGIITDRLVRVPTGEGKARAIREVVQGDLDAAFGNSRWDIAMLEIARHAFAVNPNADLERLARERRWTNYFPGPEIASGRRM
jgi:HAD superfamily phosphoserine phosphatase-like hydrolase